MALLRSLPENATLADLRRIYAVSPYSVHSALGTSIDAMAVGVSLSFLDFSSFRFRSVPRRSFMSTGGMLAGRLIGMRFGCWAEIIGGVALFGLGLSILLDHLTS
jgi:manganese efflux pump family protein